MTDTIVKKPEDLVNEESVKIALQVDKGLTAKLRNFQVKGFTKVGDNFACIVSSVLVQYEKGGKTQETSYIVKLNPCRGSQLDKMVSVIFDKENKFYSHVASRLNKELENIGEKSLKIPKYFHSINEPGSEVLYLEDLRKLGFSMFDRKKGMDKDHTNLVLRELGRLHASSLILFNKNQLRGNAILKHFPSLEEGMTKIFSDDTSAFNMDSIFGSNLSSAAEIIDGIDGYGFAVEFLRSKMNSCKAIFMDMLKCEDNMKVLCHGDCWNNNFVFKYDSKRRPIDCRLLDFQITRIGSPALDINYLFFTSLNGDVRQEYLTEFLSNYYASFASTLSCAKMLVPFTLNELTKDYYSKNLFGLLNAVAIIPTILTDFEKNTEMADVLSSMPDNEADIQKLMDDYRAKSVKAAKTNPLIKPRFLSMFDELKEQGLMGDTNVLGLIKAFNSFKSK